MEEDEKNDDVKILLPPDESEVLGSKKFTFPNNIFSCLSFHWVYDTIKKSKKNKKWIFHI